METKGSTKSSPLLTVATQNIENCSSYYGKHIEIYLYHGIGPKNESTIFNEIVQNYISINGDKK